MVAGINWTPRNAIVLALFLASFAVGNSAREPLLLKVLKAGVIVWKLAVEIVDRVP